MDLKKVKSNAKLIFFMTVLGSNVVEIRYSKEK